MRFFVEVIKHEQQRYETIGDWQFQEDGAGGFELIVRVSDLGDWRYNALVAIHEIVEALFCRKLGITTETVDKFDMEYERRRAAGEEVLEEPGDDPDAPYHHQHCLATGIERIMALAFGVSWKKYGEAIDRL